MTRPAFIGLFGVWIVAVTIAYLYQFSSLISPIVTLFGGK